MIKNQQESSGSQYHGEMKRVVDEETGQEVWLRHGKGKMKWPDGGEYDGYWADSKMCGNGRFIHANGDVYTGEFEDNKANGKGVYEQASGEWYEGFWSNDKPHGQGKQVLANGSIFEGEFKDGSKNGKGFYKWNDGCIYEGEWEND